MGFRFTAVSMQTRRVVALAVGFWAIYLCDYWAGIQTGPVADLWSWTNAYGFKAIALAVVGLLLLAVRPSRAMRTLADALSVALIEVGIFMLASSQSALASSALIQLGIVWMIVRWGTCSTTTGLRHVFFALVIGALSVSVSKILLALMPAAVSTALIALAAPIALGTMHLGSSCTEQKAQASSNRPGQPELDLKRTLLSIFSVALVFFLVWSYLNVMSKVEFGHYGYGTTSRPAMVIVSQAMAIVLFAVAFLWSFVLRRDVDLEGLWRLAILWLAVAVGASAIGGLSLISQAFVSSAFEFGFFLLYLSVAAYCHRTTADPGSILALASLSLVVPQWGMRAIVGVHGAIPLDASTASVVLIALLAVVVLLLPGRSPDTQLVARGLNEGEATPIPPASNSDGAQIARLASAFGLTDREAEVARLLASGRTKRYVAETMCLSENTIRTYARRTYQKLGVHSRSELQDLVWNTEQPDA